MLLSICRTQILKSLWRYICNFTLCLYSSIFPAYIVSTDSCPWFSLSFPWPTETRCWRAIWGKSLAASLFDDISNLFHGCVILVAYVVWLQAVLPFKLIFQYHPILQIRRQSTYELQIFKDRWERAVKQDKNWEDPFKASQRRRQRYKQRRKSKVKKLRWGYISNTINGSKQQGTTNQRFIAVSIRLIYSTM